MLGSALRGPCDHSLVVVAVVVVVVVVRTTAFLESIRFDSSPVASVVIQLVAGTWPSSWLRVPLLLASGRTHHHRERVLLLLLLLFLSHRTRCCERALCWWRPTDRLVMPK